MINPHNWENMEATASSLSPACKKASLARPCLDTGKLDTGKLLPDVNNTREARSLLNWQPPQTLHRLIAHKPSVDIDWMSLAWNISQQIVGSKKSWKSFKILTKPPPPHFSLTWTLVCIRSLTTMHNWAQGVQWAMPKIWQCLHATCNADLQCLRAMPNNADLQCRAMPNPGLYCRGLGSDAEPGL